jgi:hypothetical protein
MRGRRRNQARTFVPDQTYQYSSCGSVLPCASLSITTFSAGANDTQWPFDSDEISAWCEMDKLSAQFYLCTDMDECQLVNGNLLQREDAFTTYDQHSVHLIGENVTLNVSMNIFRDCHKIFK